MVLSFPASAVKAVSRPSTGSGQAEIAELAEKNMHPHLTFPFREKDFFEIYCLSFLEPELKLAFTQDRGSLTIQVRV